MITLNLKILNIIVGRTSARHISYSKPPICFFRGKKKSQANRSSLENDTKFKNYNFGVLAF